MSKPRVVHSAATLRDPSPKRSGVTLGVFDGVHRGHATIINELVGARESGEVDGCYLITFDPHPLVVTHSKMTPPMLTTIEERIDLLSGFDLDGIVVLHFDEALAQIDYRTFLKRYLLRPFDMKLLVLGYDLHFGRNREGSPERVKEEARRLHFDCREVAVVRNADDEAVSSTKIRNALMEGDLASANRLLGHPYLVSGKVVRGHGKGRGLGFPTANLSIEDPYKLWPPRGVYAVEVDGPDRRWQGMMNVGNAPTIKSLAQDAREVEVHLFDFEGDLYGQVLRVRCHAYLREERRFLSVDALSRQLEEDRRNAREALGRIE